ncbi:hypothetical protein OX283_005155 [Flavobacterium sp. SUN052]|uniref:pirin family protein n=1 Tax=Flavobacterium sp. SUN052 TaxID=3002441 RepID=UPI00237ED57E|nr:hypothetical protein [Flavobacterium sp. SUN052]MEC4004033.1 hypothetical protein [Flavobacterium sp. SUN052]
MLQNPSQIFKSEIRGTKGNASYKCLSTFNYLNYKEQSRKPFGNLTVFNDETLGAQKNNNYLLDENQIIVLIPLVGAIEINLEHTTDFIDVNQIRAFQLEKGKSFSILNPYENDLVNFLQIRFSFDTIIPNTISFDLDHKNEIIELINYNNFTISIGIFNARNEGIYQLKNEGLFAFVINGAFEFQNRLIENRDGLSISNISEVEFEALSENAMIMIIDTKL